MRFALLFRATRSIEIGVIPRFSPDDPVNPLLDYARSLAHDHVLVDIQGLHPTGEAKRMALTWNKQKSENPRYPGVRDPDTTYFKSNMHIDPSLAPSATHRNTPNEDCTSQRVGTAFSGPFPVEETISGWVIIDVRDEDTAVEYARKSPFPMVSDKMTIEVRKVFDSTNYLQAGRESVEKTAGSEEIQKLCREIRDEGMKTTICEEIPDRSVRKTE